MDIDKTSVKEILEERLGEEKTAEILKGIEEAYKKGKRGKELQEHFKEAIKKEGLDPEDFKFALSHVFPNPL